MLSHKGQLLVIYMGHLVLPGYQGGCSGQNMWLEGGGKEWI